MRFDRTFYMVAMVIFALFLCTTEVYANSMTAIAEEGGTVTPSGKIIGDSGSVTITPDTLPDRYQVNDVLLYEGTKVAENKLVGSVLSACTFNGLVATYNYAGLEADYTISASFVIAPVASFEIDSTSPPSDTEEPDVTVQFNDTSTNSPTSWLWDFGDGTTSTEQSPMHTYTSAGTFPVTLSVYNSQGSDPVDTATMDYVVVQPTITYNASAGPNGSISPSGELTVDEGSTTTFTISPDPLYQVTDVLVDGNSTGAVTTVTFEPADIADHIIAASFAPIPVVANFDASTASGEITTIDEVQFTDMSQGTLSSWTWDFGDGTPVSTEQNPAHTFAQAGDYTVTLTAGNAATSDSFFAVYSVASSYLSSPVMQESTSSGYFSLQVAYDDIAGLIETIRMKAGELPLEDIFIDKIDVSVLIEGGYDDTFENVVDYTVINGNVTITFGNVTMSNVIISSLN